MNDKHVFISIIITDMHNSTSLFQYVHLIECKVSTIWLYRIPVNMYGELYDMDLKTIMLMFKI